jgi:hypothetical protein
MGLPGTSFLRWDMMESATFTSPIDEAWSQMGALGPLKDFGRNPSRSFQPLLKRLFRRETLSLIDMDAWKMVVKRFENK